MITSENSDVSKDDDCETVQIDATHHEDADFSGCGEFPKGDKASHARNSLTCGGLVTAHWLSERNYYTGTVTVKAMPKDGFFT